MTQQLPAKHLHAQQMPGHWLLARLGKRVLRPGGLELTRKMINELEIQQSDRVIEFAPGLGLTAKLVLKKSPAQYTGIEADESAASQVRRYLHGDNQHCVVGRAEKTVLGSGQATVIYGEAMLTMHSLAQKQKIIREANRLLEKGGRYAIHEMALLPDDLSEGIKHTIQQKLSNTIRVNARPLTVTEWQSLLRSEGFVIRKLGKTEMHLLEPNRLLKDEGLWGVLRMMTNLIKDRQARERILRMRQLFRQYQDHLGAVMLVAEKQ